MDWLRSSNIRFFPDKVLDNVTGDIDLIAGNFYEDQKTPDFENIIAIQIKKRVITSDGELKQASSRGGSQQSHQTALMGFDKTYLLHLLIKDPAARQSGHAPMWNNFSNTIDDIHIKRCINERKDKLEFSLFGYVVIAWSQSSENNWKMSGNIRPPKVVKKAPFKPWMQLSEAEQDRSRLVEYLKSKVNPRMFNKKYPFYFNIPSKSYYQTL